MTKRLAVALLALALSGCTCIAYQNTAAPCSAPAPSSAAPEPPAGGSGK